MKRILILFFLCSSITVGGEISFKEHAILQKVAVYFPSVSDQSPLTENGLLAKMQTNEAATVTDSVVSSAESNGWTVITSAGDTLRSCIIGRLERDLVDFTCDSSVIQLSVDSLKMLVRHRESRFLSGIGYGTLAGATLGALIGLVTYEKPTGYFAIDFGPGVAALGGGILGGVLGFAIGGIVGAGYGGDERYDLSQEPTEEKIKILRGIRREDR